MIVRRREQERQCGCLCVHACISMCASERVCILFMARNQLSLAHNGNVNSPERLSPTQGENWLGACCIFPNPNSERQVAGLKSCPLFSPSLERFTALPVHYSNRSSKQVSLAIWKHIRTHMRTHATHTAKRARTHTHTFTLVGSMNRWRCSYYDRWHLIYGSLSTTAPKCYA